VPGDRDAEGDGADDRGPQVRVVGGDGLGDLRLVAGDAGAIGEFARRSRLSPKALRLYDGLGLLSPARVDELSGYRYYEDAQLQPARLIATLRQVGVPLATVMYEVASREMPQRSLLGLKRNVDESGLWGFGKEFIAIIRDQRLPRIGGREGAMFCIYWGEVSADSDGPVEWCKPVPADQAEALAAQFPELTLRVEPAHREAYVDLGPGGQIDTTQWQLAYEALVSWRDTQGIEDEQLSLTPDDLGVRITYLATPPITDASVPDCDFAVPFA
jgi:hypothetical protein